MRLIIATCLLFASLGICIYGEDVGGGIPEAAIAGLGCRDLMRPASRYSRALMSSTTSWDEMVARDPNIGLLSLITPDKLGGASDPLLLVEMYTFTILGRDMFAPIAPRFLSSVETIESKEGGYRMGYSVPSVFEHGKNFDVFVNCYFEVESGVPIMLGEIVIETNGKSLTYIRNESLGWELKGADK